MKNFAFGLLFAFISASALADDELKVHADRIAADRNTGALTASGNVVAVSHPYRLLCETLVRDAEGKVTLSDPSTVTTCTNETCSLHWRATGEVAFQAERFIMFRNLWLYAWEVPVMWMPYWYYPLDTEYGWRVMPGYTSRWGAYLLTKYVYHIAGDPSGEEGSFGLRGATRFDLRKENGVAFGQSLRWRLGDFGKGHVKGYYVWDDDYDRYERNWSNKKHWNYRNWGSTVEEERYSFELEHQWEPTERDIVRVAGSVFSDSYFRRDFLRSGMLYNRNDYLGYTSNEFAWEHNERTWGSGVSVSGPLNDFYGGVARLPEVYFDVVPQPLWGLPVNYESDSRAGYLNRTVTRHGNSSAVTPFSHKPGPWAEYNTFRLDSYHRLTAPFKLWDALAIAPRAGVRATYWGESGHTLLDGRRRAGETGDDILRTIAEGGITFSARGTAWINDRWQHLLEPYADVLVQEAGFSGDSGDSRPYVFDNIDTSTMWEDQFAGGSRSLPYSWCGVTPGLRNAFRRADESGRLHTVFDVDAYAAVQCNESKWIGDDPYSRLAENGEPNMGEDSPFIVPGVRVRWFPDSDIALGVRAEYDGENSHLAYSSLDWSHRINPSFRYNVSWGSRHHRWWDFATTYYDERRYDEDIERDEDFNWANYSYLMLQAEHELCDAIAWGPYIRWDCREDELDEVGAWIDYRTDCLGFRLIANYENAYTRIDGSEYDEDWSFGFFVYLRAIGPEMGSVFGGD